MGRSFSTASYHFESFCFRPFVSVLSLLSLTMRSLVYWAALLPLHSLNVLANAPEEADVIIEVTTTRTVTVCPLTEFHTCEADVLPTAILPWEDWTNTPSGSAATTTTSKGSDHSISRTRYDEILFCSSVAAPHRHLSLAGQSSASRLTTPAPGSCTATLSGTPMVVWAFNSLRDPMRSMPSDTTMRISRTSARPTRHMRTLVTADIPMSPVSRDDICRPTKTRT